MIERPAPSPLTLNIQITTNNHVPMKGKRDHEARPENTEIVGGKRRHNYSNYSPGISGKSGDRGERREERGRVYIYISIYLYIYIYIREDTRYTQQDTSNTPTHDEPHTQSSGKNDNTPTRCACARAA